MKPIRSPHDSAPRFLVAGAVNTCFGLLIYAAARLGGAEDWLALLIALSAGLGFNFITLGGYAFRNLSLHRLPKFILAYFAIYALNLGLLRGLVEWTKSDVWAQVALTPFMAGLSYLIQSKWVFARKAGRCSK